MDTAFRDGVDSRVAGVVSPVFWNRVRGRFGTLSFVVAVYIGLTSLLAFRWGLLSLVGWWVGVYAGWWLLGVDHVIDVFWVSDDEDLKHYCRKLVTKRDWKTLATAVLDVVPHQKHLLLHSVIFEAVVVVLSVYVTFSSGFLWAKGLMLGLLGRMVWEQIQTMRKDGSLGMWMWQVVGEVPNAVQALIVAAGCLVWLWLTVVGL